MGYYDVAAMNNLGSHVSDHDLERYYRGMSPAGAELDVIEEHLLICDECNRRCDEAADYIDEIRRATIEGDYDLR